MAVDDIVREVAQDASLLLLVGGLSMLVLVVALLLLQGMIPRKFHPLPTVDGPPPEPRPPRGAAPQAGLGSRLRPRSGPPPPPIDYALDAVLAVPLGEPRIFRHNHHYTVLRLY